MHYAYILWMDQILHLLRNPGIMIPLKIATNHGFPQFHCGAKWISSIHSMCFNMLYYVGGRICCIEFGVIKRHVCSFGHSGFPPMGCGVSIEPRYLKAPSILKGKNGATTNNIKHINIHIYTKTHAFVYTHIYVCVSIPSHQITWNLTGGPFKDLSGSMLIGGIDIDTHT